MTTETLSSTHVGPGAHERQGGAERPRPFLFLVLECGRPRAPSARFALGDTDEVVVGRGGSRAAWREARRLSLEVPDPWMSTRHATFTPVLGRWSVEDAASRNGVLVNGERQPRAILGDGDVIELGRSFFIFRDRIPVLPEDDVDLAAGSGAFATVVPGLVATFRRLDAIARSAASVVLQGETGSGKEVVAREIHRRSQRRGALVAVNCGGLPESLLESELFGHVKGAFSGAVADRPGLVRCADHGTLFLDEIGDLRQSSQAALLRVLQEREVVPIGAAHPAAVDLRLLSASHRDLEALVAAGELRADLLARLSGFKVELPPLRARLEDLGTLVAAILDRLVPGKEVTLDPRAARALLHHRWPLNVRELEKALGAAVVLAGNGPIGREHLPASVDPPPRAVAAPEPAAEDAHDTLPFSSEDLEFRERLIRLLEQHRGNVAAIARELGKARMQILRWLKRFGLDADSYRR